MKNNEELKSVWVLLILRTFDVLVGSWLGSWFIASFSRMLSGDIIGIRNLIISVVGGMSMYITITYYRRPNYKLVFVLNMLSYPILFCLNHSAGLFVITNVLYGSLIKGVSKCHTINLINSNLQGESRVMYDNYSELLSSIGGGIGSGLFIVFSMVNTDPKIIWFVVFVLFDLDVLISTILIKKGVLKYNK